MIDIKKYTGFDKSEIFHSSGQARSARGAQIGSAGGQQTLGQRSKVTAERSIVKAYKDSALGSRYGTQRARTFQQSQARRAAGSVDEKGGAFASAGSRRAAFNTGNGPNAPSSPSSARYGYQEPARRGYNPYS